MLEVYKFSLQWPVKIFVTLCEILKLVIWGEGLLGIKSIVWGNHITPTEMPLSVIRHKRANVWHLYTCCHLACLLVLGSDISRSGSSSKGDRSMIHWIYNVKWEGNRSLLEQLKIPSKTSFLSCNHLHWYVFVHDVLYEEVRGTKPRNALKKIFFRL